MPQQTATSKRPVPKPQSPAQQIATGVVLPSAVNAAITSGVMPTTAQLGAWALPAAGIAAGGMGIHNLSQNRERIGTGGGMLQGAASGAAAGASAGSIVPGVGTALGALVGGLGGLAYGGIGGASRTEQEDKRRGNLIKQGVNLFQFNPGMEEKYNAEVRKDLPPDFVGFDDKGNWVNNKFATSRNESALTGRDIDKYAAFSELFGNKWSNASDDTRFAIGDEVIKRGLGREHHGTFDVNADQAFLDFANSMLGEEAITPTNTSAATTSSRKNTSERKRKRRPEVDLSDITPIGAPKPPRYAYTPESQPNRTIQDYVDLITRRKV